jgi:hypothetical protein
MSNKKQTAVKFLHSEYKKIIGDTQVTFAQMLKITDALEQAKEMEKQQIIDAWYIGIEKEGEEHGHTFLWHRKDLAEQYYNENYEI